MTQAMAIEDADSPEAFVRAIRKQAEKCYEDASELQSAWGDKDAGRFWTVAGRKLEKLADSLEQYMPGHVRA